jgi:hypothetical protein
MSVVDQLKNLFSKKPQESELDSRLSLAMPDATVDAVGQETVQESQNAPLQAQAIWFRCRAWGAVRYRSTSARCPSCWVALCWCWLWWCSSC